jgi:hypothetical protein
VTMGSWVRSLLGALGGRRSRIDERRRLYRLGRDEYRYCEDDRCLVLQIDMKVGEVTRCIYAATIRKWLPPHDHEPLEPEQRRQIALAIQQFLNASGDPAEIDWSP